MGIFLFLQVARVDIENIILNKPVQSKRTRTEKPLCGWQPITAPTGKRAEEVIETFVSLNKLLW